MPAAHELPGVKEFISFVVGRLAERPDAAVLHDESDAGSLRYRVEVARPDVGRIIGRGGTTIAAVRSLLAAVAARHGQRVFLDVVERRGS